MTPWLTQADFSARISGGIPASIDADKVFGPIVRDIVDSTLTDILGAKVTELKAYMPSGSGNTDLDNLKIATVAFLVYATYSEYVLTGNIMATQTGLVTKDTDNSTPIEKEQRAELHVLYRGKADKWARKLARLATTDVCKPVVLSSRRIKVAKRKSNSYFDR